MIIVELIYMIITIILLKVKGFGATSVGIGSILIYTLTCDFYAMNYKFYLSCLTWQHTIIIYYPKQFFDILMTCTNRYTAFMWGMYNYYILQIFWMRHPQLLSTGQVKGPLLKLLTRQIQN